MNTTITITKKQFLSNFLNSFELWEDTANYFEKDFSTTSRQFELATEQGTSITDKISQQVEVERKNYIFSNIKNYIEQSRDLFLRQGIEIDIQYTNLVEEGDFYQLIQEFYKTIYEETNPYDF